MTNSPIPMRIDHARMAMIAAQDLLKSAHMGELADELADTLEEMTVWTERWYEHNGPEAYEGGLIAIVKKKSFLWI